MSIGTEKSWYPSGSVSGSGAQSPFSVAFKTLKFLTAMGAKTYNNRQQVKKVPLKMLTSKSFWKKKRGPKFHFPNPLARRLVACLRWPFLRFRGGSQRWLRSRSLRRPGLGRHGTCRVGAVQRNLGIIFWRQFGVGFFEGSCGWGASFE